MNIAGRNPPVQWYFELELKAIGNIAGKLGNLGMLLRVQGSRDVMAFIPACGYATEETRLEYLAEMGLTPWFRLPAWSSGRLTVSELTAEPDTTKPTTGNYTVCWASSASDESSNMCLPMCLLFLTGSNNAVGSSMLLPPHARASYQPSQLACVSAALTVGKYAGKWLVSFTGECLQTTSNPHFAMPSSGWAR